MLYYYMYINGIELRKPSQHTFPSPVDTSVSLSFTGEYENNGLDTNESFLNLKVTSHSDGGHDFYMILHPDDGNGNFSLDFDWEPEEEARVIIEALKQDGWQECSTEILNFRDLFRDSFGYRQVVNRSKINNR